LNTGKGLTNNDYQPSVILQNQHAQRLAAPIPLVMT